MTHKKKRAKETVESVTAGLVSQRDKLLENIQHIEPEVTGKEYVSKVYRQMKSLGIVSSMQTMSRMLGGRNNYFNAISREPDETQRRINLSFIPAMKLHTMTNGIFDIDRMLPWFAETAAKLGYYRLDRGKITDQCEERLTGLGYKKRKPRKLVKPSVDREKAA